MKKIRIWQLSPENIYCFMNYDFYKRNNGEPSLTNYNMVYDGAIKTNDLEEIFTIFNLDKPKDFNSRSLSTSDIVELYGNNQREFYYCDRCGFKQIKIRKGDLL